MVLPASKISNISRTITLIWGVWTKASDDSLSFPHYITVLSSILPHLFKWSPTFTPGKLPLQGVTQLPMSKTSWMSLFFARTTPTFWKYHWPFGGPRAEKVLAICLGELSQWPRGNWIAAVQWGQEGFCLDFLWVSSHAFITNNKSSWKWKHPKGGRAHEDWRFVSL